MLSLHATVQRKTGIPEHYFFLRSAYFSREFGKKRVVPDDTRLLTSL